MVHFAQVRDHCFPPLAYSELKVDCDYDAVGHDLLFEQWYTPGFPRSIERHVPVLVVCCASEACRSSTTGGGGFLPCRWDQHFRGTDFILWGAQKYVMHKSTKQKSKSRCDQLFFLSFGKKNKGGERSSKQKKITEQNSRVLRRHSF
jgi:hypothetical protein